MAAVPAAQAGATARVPLVFENGFAWRAVAAVIAEKFGLRGLRIGAMIGVMTAYLWWRGCDGFLCMILYVLVAAMIVMALSILWTAKGALDRFVMQHAQGAWLVLDESGVGGESAGERFHLPWSDFRRVTERHRLWVLEMRHGAWMVLPTGRFSPEAWAIMRAHRR